MKLTHKFLLFSFALLLFVQFFFFAPDAVQEWSPQDSQSETRPEQTMTGVSLHEKSTEGKDWELVAERAEAISAKKDWLLYDVEIKFYGKEMEYMVYADEADIDTTTSDMKIKGNVRVITSNEFEFRSSKINYLGDRRNLYSPGRTQLISPKDKSGAFVDLEADEMTASLNVNQVLAIGNVNAIRKSKQGAAVIQSAEATFDLDTKISRFVKDVEIDYNTSKVLGPIASLLYDEKKDLFATLEVSGGTQLRDKNRTAVAKNMDFDLEKNQLILSGNPRLIQDGDELIGEKILLLDGGNRIKVMGAKAQIEDSIE